MHTQIVSGARRMAGLAAIPLLAACSSGSGGGSQGQVAGDGDGGAPASASDGGTQGTAPTCSTTETVLNMMIDGQFVSVTGSNLLVTVGSGQAGTGALDFQANGLPLDKFTGALSSPGTTTIQQGATITIGNDQTTSFIVTGNGGTMGTVGGEFASGTVITINALAYHPTDPNEPAGQQTLDSANMTFVGDLHAPGTGHVEGCLNFVGTPGADQ